MRYRLRTLLIAVAVGPPAIWAVAVGVSSAWEVWGWGELKDIELSNGVEVIYELKE